jgi:hypothetical protein
VFRYRLHSPDGDLGEATYAQMIHLGDEIIADKNQRFRVLDVVPFEEEDESPFVGLLQAGPAPSASRESSDPNGRLAPSQIHSREGDAFLPVGLF